MAEEDLIVIDLGAEDEYDLDLFLQGFAWDDSEEEEVVSPSEEESAQSPAGGGSPLENAQSPDGGGSPSENAQSPAGGGSPSSALENSSGSPCSEASWMSEIERFLLLDEEEADGESFGDVAELPCDVFADLFADALQGETLDLVEGAKGAKGEAEGEKEKEKVKEKRAASDGAEEEDDDPISKKRRRQMRNRDSAIKSRERKKIYVNDLEMKSKYLESECRRLDFALRCCMAENVALRQSAQKKRPLGALVSKQESAVLFVESLLLGSLFWFMSMVCLFLLPGLPISKRKDVSRVGGPAHEVVWTKRVVNERVRSGLRPEFINMRRRCRGMRTKMKNMFFLHAIFA